MEKNTANKILDTATSLFAVHGFENVTIKQLAKASNINIAAISYYFGGKESLYQEVLKRQFSPAILALRKVEISCGLTANERLRDYGEMIAEIKRKQPYLTSLWHYEMNRHHAAKNSLVVKEYTAQLYQHILSALSQGISQKEFLSDLEPYSTASVLLEMMYAPYVSASVLTEQALSAEDNRKAYTVQAIQHYLLGIKNIPF